MPAPYRRIGRVNKPHGTKGEVSVALSAGLPDSCLIGLHVWLVPPGPRGARMFTVTSVRHGPRSAIVRFNDDQTAGDAGALAGRWLLAREADLPQQLTAHDDYLGKTVIDAERGTLGAVTGLIVTGANDVLVVEGGAYGQVLIPVIDDVVRDVDADQGVIAVTVLPGLIDEEPS